MSDLKIENLISINETGMPQPPALNQIIDKDIYALYSRDSTPDKSRYFKECGVIYYLYDPRSPARQNGLSDKESLKAAIEQFDLPINFVPDALMNKIGKRYWDLAVGPAGLAVDNLLRALHTVSIIANKSHSILVETLDKGVEDSDLSKVVANISIITEQIKSIPNLQKALTIAKENLVVEQEQAVARGGVAITSSMNADEN